MSGRTVSGELTTSWPNTSICPEVGMRSVEAIRRNVVLPAPFRPRSAIRSPRRRARDTPRNASTSGEPRPWYTFRTSTARSASCDTGRSKRTLRIKLDSAQFDFSKRSEEHTSELQSLAYLVCRLLLEKKKQRAYARAAATKGTRDAFLEFLADDGIIFQPGPVNGKQFWQARTPRKGILT